MSKTVKMLVKIIVGVAVSFSLVACGKAQSTDTKKAADTTKVSQEVKKEVKVEPEEAPKEEAKTEPTKVVVREEYEVYVQLHEMTNSLVKAQDKWGTRPMTEEGIASLIAEVNASNFADKDKLLLMLNRWKEGNFSNVALDHNYVWSQLGGTVGEATGVNEMFIPGWAVEKQSAKWVKEVTDDK